jgi:hypothetical protein
MSVPGGALLSSPITDAFGGNGAAGVLDVLQGNPARIRNLSVGFGSLRTIRAESAVAVPLIEADLRLEAGRLKGTIRNSSTQLLESPAVVLGQTVAVLNDLAPGAEATVDVAVRTGQFAQSLSDTIVGQAFFNSNPGSAPETARAYVRHSMVDQLTYDPTFGNSNLLPFEGPVILAWGSAGLLPVEVAGQQPTSLGNVLYYLPARMTVRGLTTFRSDLIRSTVVASDAVQFGKDMTSLNFGRGSATIAYRPIGFEGRLTATELAIGLNVGDRSGVPPVPIVPLPEIPPACPNPPTKECVAAGFNQVPEVELFEIATQTWVRLPRFESSVGYSVADPGRYVDPASGSVIVRFVNDKSDQVGFGVDISITGKVQ